MTTTQTITIGPHTAKSLAELETFTMNGVTFTKGDRVWVVHKGTGSKALGRVASFYGVGRVRGVKIEDTPFGTIHFPFGQPGDSKRFSLEQA